MIGAASLAAACLVSGAARIALPVSSFTLRWRHTVEKVLWEEDYRVAGRWLYLSHARIRGSGAGIEPPEAAVLIDGVWHYRPALRLSRKVTLARSEFGADYELCFAGGCWSLERWLPSTVSPVTIEPC